MEDMAQGLRAAFGQASRHMEMLSENLANAGTPGYRSGEVLTEPFHRILDSRVAAMQERDATDLTPGAVRMTDRPLDVALQGDGFFVVRAERGELLTRNGAFEMAPDGGLTTVTGHAVLGEDGQPLRIPPGVSPAQVQVHEDGSVWAGDAQIGRFRIERVDRESDLRRVGTTLFETPADRRRPAEGIRVMDRSLESSNTSVFQEMSRMILLTRSVEALQRAQSAEAQAQGKMMDALTG